MTKKWTVADAPMPNFAKAIELMRGEGPFKSLEELNKHLDKMSPKRIGMGQKKAIGGPIKKKYARGSGIRKTKKEKK